MSMWHWLRTHTPARGRIWFRRARAGVIDPFGRGVPVLMGGVRVRVPAYFAGGGRADYEAPAVARAVRWLERHPAGLLVDVGCSLSIYGVVALSCAPAAEVIAIDADPVGLKCTARLCSKVSNPHRLRLVHGLVVNRADASPTLAEAAAATRRALADTSIPEVAEAIRYVPRTPAAGVPQLTIDRLLAGVPPSRAMLLKIDVEGAELDVLHSAAATLRRARPALLLSVHPQFGVDVAALRAWLAANGYTAGHFAADHEEHWWCEPAGAGLSP